MKIHILTSKDAISYYFFYPLLRLRQLLGDRDCLIIYFSRITEALWNSDVLLIDNRWFTPLWRDRRDEALGILAEIRKKQAQVIWLDVTDSSGATQFQVLPFVDRYLKKQLLKDRSLYQKEFYGARIYTDYYKKTFSLPEEEVYFDEPLDPKFADKLRLSWNLGLGPCQMDLRISGLICRFPFFVKQAMACFDKARFFSAGQRTNDICFRGSDRYNNRAIAFQRLELIKRLQARGVATQPVVRSRYLEELRNSKICASPFGAGEICFRDFEIILNGGLLLKPDMTHLETWPDVFVPEETYVPFRWDFSDLDEQLERLLSQPQEVETIADQAQERYRRFLSPQGQQEFLDRFRDLVTL